MTSSTNSTDQMSINERYFIYLDTFNKTSSLSEFNSKANTNTNIVCLRHDIDHDLDIALEFAYHEHRLGYRASYFILHDHRYNSDPLFLEKLLQIQDYGHEIGIHLNPIAGWYAGSYERPVSHLKSWLAKLRCAGVRVIGSATHGDRLCYEGNFINSWLFSEQCARAKVATGLSAEGIVDPTNERVIKRPDQNYIVRPDGSRLYLWQTSMAELGLEYEAVDLDACYWSDTGKDWHRTGNPIKADLSTGCHQVLMHPIHWIGKPRRMVFLSSARSGSKWLAQALATTTAIKVEHEWTLNHRQRSGQHTEEKLTTLDFRALEEKPNTVTALIKYSRRFHSTQRKNVAEFNVYLAHFTEGLSILGEEYEYYALLRDGEKVVRSIINRGWYATLDDRYHPTIQHDNWCKFTQLERACHYWADVTSTICDFSDDIFRLEDISKSELEFAKFLQSLNLPVHARLLNALSFVPVDKMAIPPGRRQFIWTVDSKSIFYRICGEVAKSQGYKLTVSSSSDTMSIKLGIQYLLQFLVGARSVLRIFKPQRKYFSVDLVNYDASWHPSIKLTSNGELQLPDLTSWIIFDLKGMSTWSELAPKAGMSLGRGYMELSGQVMYVLDGQAKCRLFYLEYNKRTRKCCMKKQLTLLQPGWSGKFQLLVSDQRNEKRFCLGIHVSDARNLAALKIKSFQIQLKKLPMGYLATMAKK